MSNRNRIKYSDKLRKILNNLNDNGDFLAFELLWLSDKTSDYQNNLKITDVDYDNDEGSDYNFIVTINGEKKMMKIGKFIRYYFVRLFNDDEIRKFVLNFNKIKKGGEPDKPGVKIIVPEFKLNAKDPRSTFLSMVTETYPHPNEEGVVKYLPSGLSKDRFGNYYKIISGDDTTMFTSHLDTADRRPVKTTLYSRIDDGDEIIYTAGDTILGADDKSGVTVMMYMMAHNIPGIYYFFIGEERGGIGSNQLADYYEQHEYLNNVTKCISFDRRKNFSLITHQMGGRCCSDVFGNALCELYNTQGMSLSLDNGGVYTDSASFMDIIPECTNLSVGYINEHTFREEQNMTYLIQLCETSINVDWKSLPIGRKVGLNQELMNKHKKFIETVKETLFGLEVKMIGYDGRVYIRIDLDNTDIELIYDNLSELQNLLNRNKMKTVIEFDETYVKIELY